jgi:CDGSH-type Zn-finger protein
MSDVKELDPNAEIGGTDDMGGFELPRLGKIKDGTGVLMEFTGEIKLSKKENGLIFHAADADDSSKKATIYCGLKDNKGLSQIVGIGKNSGVFEKINTKRIAAGKKSILSDNGTVKTKILQDAKFHEQLRAEIEGCKVICDITHSPAKPYKDEETGEEKEGFPNANIGKIAPADTKQVTPAKAAATGAAASETAPVDDEWED